MTMNEELRDVMAAIALNGMLSVKDWFANGGRWRTKEEMFTAYAEESYGFADAMIEARKQKDNDDEEDDSGIASVAPKRTRRKSR